MYDCVVCVHINRRIGLHTRGHTELPLNSCTRTCSKNTLKICTRLRPGHLSVRDGGGSRHKEEIVKNLELRL